MANVLEGGKEGDGIGYWTRMPKKIGGSAQSVA